MCATMRHRGPDEDGFLVQGNIGLGMRRLKIIDLNTGTQPIYNETGDVGIVYNGEVYNFQPLRRELEAKGHRFRTQTDTETIVHAYEEYGDACVEKLNGMFVFALWDATKQRLLLARDRAGQKPLFYFHAPDGKLVFGSEIKVLLASGEVPHEVNPDAVYHYLSTQYVLGPGTILQRVQQLPAAHTAVWQDGQLSLARYWQASYIPKPSLTHDEWIDRTRDTVTAAVQRHLVSDVPIGAYLSGGVDSSIVVAIMSELASGRVNTFSIGFDVAAYSETEHARRIAQRYNTNHHEFIVSAADVTDTIADVIYFADQPLADTSLMATYLLAQHTREHVTVALTGDGGDEAFAGYTRYTLDKLLRYYRLLPRAIRSRLVPTLAALLPERPHVPTDRNVVAGVKRLAHASSTTHKASILAWGSFFTEAQKQALCDPEWLSTVEAVPTPQHIARHYDAARALSHMDRTLYADFVAYLQDDLLVKADRMAMAHGLETRAPFLDNEVLALGQTMPESMRIRGNVQKYALRQAFKEALPAENVRRIKRGFGMPIAAWLRGHMRHSLQETLTDHTTRQRGYFEQSYIQQLLTEHDAGMVNHGQRLWALYMLEIWHRTVLEHDFTSKPVLLSPTKHQ